MSVLYTESIFPRAARDDCTRAAGAVQGPYPPRVDVTALGHRVAFIVCGVGWVGIFVALAAGWLT